MRAHGWRDRDRIRPIPALIAAVAFMLSDLFVTHVGNYNLIAVIAWLPLIFLSFHRRHAILPPPRVAPSPGVVTRLRRPSSASAPLPDTVR